MIRSLDELPKKASTEVTAVVLCLLAAPSGSNEQDYLERALPCCAQRHGLSLEEMSFVYLTIKQRVQGGVLHGIRERASLAQYHEERARSV